MKHLDLLNKNKHIDVLSIAIPMILSNITVPLLGLVDSAVIGHLEHASYLGGVAIGGIMVNVIVWLFGFLRMATTGVTAQAYGARDKKKQAQILLQGISIALVFSFLILAISRPLSPIVLNFSDASFAIKSYAKEYFFIRILSCPAALVNLVFMGWLLGNHQAKKAMWLLIFVNSMNIALDLIFVPGLKLGVKGAAMASTISDYSGSILGLYFIFTTWFANELSKIKIKEVFEDILKLLKLNLDIFIRSLFLQLVFSFMVFKGATFGDTIAAVNAILMNFVLFISYLMDGFAYTMETLIGSALGSKNQQKLRSSLYIATFWSLIISLLCTLIFAFFGDQIVHFMSSINEVQIISKEYMPWLIAFPLISMWSFLLDGVFVGATLGKEMRNGMIIASTVYFISYTALQHHNNHALWATMLIFMGTRWLVLAGMIKLNKQVFNF